MNPHRMAWELAANFPIAQCVAIATILGFIFTKDRLKNAFARETGMMIGLWACFTWTTVFSAFPELAWEEWLTTSKILLMAIITIFLCSDFRKLKYLLLTIAASIGFYGLKGLVFVVATAGEHRIYGPPKSFIADNNDLALALVMVLPIFLYLAIEEKNWKYKSILITGGVSCLFSTVFTYSRGGMLGLGALAFFLP
jgi:probable O-glycosylation ligase (exosortase A-associated)